jgi:hypothetical protein
MTPDAVKWALFDLLKSLDALHGGQYHEGFQRIAQGLGYGCTKTWRTRTMSDPAKWAVFDLLKALDTIHGGQHHERFARITQGLGLELPVVATPAPDQTPDGAFGDNGGQDDALSSLLELLDTLWPASQNPHGFRADQVAGRMVDQGPELDAQAQALRDSLDAIGPCPLNALTAHAIGNRLRPALDRPVPVEGAVLVLRKRSNPSDSNLPSYYRIVREPRP